MTGKLALLVLTFVLFNSCVGKDKEGEVASFVEVTKASSFEGFRHTLLVYSPYDSVFPILVHTDSTLVVDYIGCVDGSQGSTPWQDEGMLLVELQPDVATKLYVSTYREVFECDSIIINSKEEEFLVLNRESAIESVKRIQEDILMQVLLSEELNRRVLVHVQSDTCRVNLNCTSSDLAYAGFISVPEKVLQVECSPEIEKPVVSRLTLEEMVDQECETRNEMSGFILQKEDVYIVTLYYRCNGSSLSFRFREGDSGLELIDSISGTF